MMHRGEAELLVDDICVACKRLMARSNAQHVDRLPYCPPCYERAMGLVGLSPEEQLVRLARLTLEENAGSS